MYTQQSASAAKFPVTVMTKIFILQGVQMMNSANRRGALMEDTNDLPFRKVQYSMRQTYYNYSEDSPQYMAFFNSYDARFWGNMEGRSFPTAF